MSQSPDLLTPYDQFNFEVPEDHFPKMGMSSRAAQALVLSDEWTDTNRC